MTVPATYSPPSYYANGVSTVFPYGFKVLSADHLLVTVNGSIVLNTIDFTVSGVGSESGGNVTFLAAPGNNDLVEIMRNVPVERLVDYQPGGDLPASTLNADIDKVVMMIQTAIAAGSAFNAPIDIGDLNPPGDASDVDNPTNDVVPNDSTNRVNTQTVVSYTATIHDAWGLVEMDYPTACEFVIPKSDTVAYKIGTAIHIVQRGAGTLSIDVASGVSTRCAATLVARERFSIIVVYYRGNDEWYVGGDLSLTSFVADPSPPATQVLTVPTGYYWYTRYLRFNIDGSISKCDVAGTITALGLWHSGTPVASDYEIYCQQTGGDMENNASAAKNAWLPLTSPRQWEVENSTGTKFCTVRISIRQISTGLLASNTYTLDRRVSA